MPPIHCTCAPAKCARDLKIGEPFIAGQNRLCWLWLNSPEYQKAWTEQPLLPAAVRTDCIHLGPVLPDQVGRCVDKIRKCDIHGQCTTGRCSHSPRACPDCADYENDLPEPDFPPGEINRFPGWQTS